MAAARGAKVPTILREPFEIAQARIGALEAETQRLWKALRSAGKGGRRELSEIAEKLTKQDWTLGELKSRLLSAGSHGLGAAAGLRDRARDGARDQIGQLYGKAVNVLGVATRDQVERLGKEMERLAQQLKKTKQGRAPARRTNHKAEGRRARH